MKKRNNKGFSLIELIVVIAIMAVFVGVLAPTLIRYIRKARESTALNNAQSFETTVNTVMAEAASGELGNQALKDASEFSVQYLSSTADPPDADATYHPLINAIYDTFNPNGRGFEAIAIIEDYRVIQITYKDLKTRKVYVYYRDEEKCYGSSIKNSGKSGEWLSFDTAEGEAWVGKYSIYEDKYTKQYWNGH